MPMTVPEEVVPRNLRIISLDCDFFTPRILYVHFLEGLSW